MISMTDEARALLQRRLAAGVSGGGLRITVPAARPTEGSEIFDLDVADAPGPGEWVQDAGGLRLFLNPGAASALAGGRIGVEGEELVLDFPAAGMSGRSTVTWEGSVLVANTDRELPHVEVPEAPAHHRVRPLWLVAALTILTGGLYPMVWLGLTWAELRRERDDPDMHPWWHALTQFVPFYGYFVFKGHFDTIKATLHRIDAHLTVHPGRALLGWLLGTWLVSAGGKGALTGVAGLVADTAGAAVVALVIAHGQDRLNVYWRAASRGAARAQVRGRDWLALALSLTYFALVTHGKLFP